MGSVLFVEIASVHWFHKYEAVAVRASSWSALEAERFDKTFVMIAAHHRAAIALMGRALCWGSGGNGRASGILELLVDETLS